jgi:Holliday junction DNA helicase RuvA
MIGRLRGTVADVGAETALIDVQGVGYLVHCPVSTLARLTPGEAAEVTVETVVREDMIRLYGFTSAAERDWFRLLQNVQGVGARVAIAVLSVLDAGALAAAVAGQDDRQVARANGVGPKLAKRIVSELKDKAPAAALAAAPPPAPGKKGPPPDPKRAAHADAVSALVNLGYPQHEASRALSLVAAEAEAAGEDLSVQQLIRKGLKELAS